MAERMNATQAKKIISRVATINRMFIYHDKNVSEEYIDTVSDMMIRSGESTIKISTDRTFKPYKAIRQLHHESERDVMDIHEMPSEGRYALKIRYRRSGNRTGINIIAMGSDIDITATCNAAYIDIVIRRLDDIISYIEESDTIITQKG